MSATTRTQAVPDWVNAVQLALSALSVVGASAIVVGRAFSPQRSHLRQKLVLGLGLVDFVQSVTTLSGSALQMSGNPYATNSPSCNASGFVYQTCVITQACWTLAITITTYSTLVHPFSRLSALLEHRRAFPAITAVVLLVSVTPNIPILSVYDMVNAGGMCLLQPGTRRASLTLFIPRALTLVIVISLYLGLFIFFRRRDVGMLDTTSDRRDDYEDLELHGGKCAWVASLSARLASRHRRSSDTIHHPSPQHTRSGHPEAIPASSVQSTDSFPSSSQTARDPASLGAGLGEPSPATLPQPSTPTDDSRNERQNSVTVSFSGVDPPSSCASTPDLPGSDSTPLSGAPSTRSQRLSSAAFPGRMSGSSYARRGSQQQQQQERSRRVSLTPRQLNKRLSLLMAVFPLAYAALVAVSVARLIQELSTNARAPTGLLYTSRFLIMSQGTIDGILFVFVQTAFRWWVRRDTERA